MVGGGQRSEQAVVDLGVEDRQALAVGGQDVGVGVFDPADQVVEAQAAQVVGHLAGAVVCSEQPGGQGAQALVGQTAGAGQGEGQGAGQGHDPGLAEPQGRGPPAILGEGGLCDPLDGWARKDAVLAGTHSLQQPVVDVMGLGGQFGEVFQAAQDADVVGVVDDGLDPQRPAVFEVSLDAGVPVEGVDDHAVVVPVDGGAEHALGDAADLPVEDDLRVVRAADVQVAGGQGVEERPGVPGGGEGDGLGDLDLAHGDVPPVA